MTRLSYNNCCLNTVIYDIYFFFQHYQKMVMQVVGCYQWNNVNNLIRLLIYWEISILMTLIWYVNVYHIIYSLFGQAWYIKYTPVSIKVSIKFYHLNFNNSTRDFVITVQLLRHKNILFYHHNMCSFFFHDLAHLKKIPKHFKDCVIQTNNTICLTHVFVIHIYNDESILAFFSP